MAPRKDAFRFVNYVWDIFDGLGTAHNSYMYSKVPAKVKCNIATSSTKAVVQVEHANAINSSQVISNYYHGQVDVVANSIFSNTHLFFVAPAINMISSRSMFSAIFPQLLHLWREGVSPVSFELEHYSVDGTTIFFWPYHLCVYRDSLVAPRYSRKHININPCLSLHSTTQERMFFMKKEALYNFTDAIYNCILMIAKLLADEYKKPITQCSRETCIGSHHKMCEMADDIRRRVATDPSYTPDVEAISVVIASIVSG